ncbi:head-tail joining protein [Methylobacterium dankookense]|uniref:Uncharacterized protein n=1 Tax=Methylobacterium dankookense TaxID=560405 RepID=A0A564G6H5_9HYPH|nr:hypothetical protein [Methylobacterium dankookense]GJD58361.1 hypothetical protein IFDJLNFL_4280 [Methylobacterium dankookense]VUF15634.1 hypothetical protein MTDSW087_05378 [Methylobacterium dankookense]
MIDFDRTVLAACQDVFGDMAILTPVKSSPGGAAFPVRGIYALKPADSIDGDGVVVREDNYTFSVRASELPAQVARGDRVSDIALPFMAGRVFTIEDTGDDGFGAQAWVLKERKIDPRGA